jgi:hypothetical protein
MVSSLRPSDHPVLLSSLLFLCNSSDATRKWTVGSSDGAYGFTQCTNSSDACYIDVVGSSDGVLSFPFLSSRLQLGSLLQLNILNMPLLIASKYILSPQICYK